MLLLYSLQLERREREGISVRRIAMCVVAAGALLSGSAQAQVLKITGPWLWMIAPTDAGVGGAASTDKDQLDKASGGKVTEDGVAKNGAKEGDAVGKLKWTLGEISDKGGNNVNDTVTKIGLGAGDVNDHSSYALITIEAANEQKSKTMWVGSDDSIKVWLNGAVVHKNAIDRGADNFQDQFKVDLKKGDNLLLVKVSERGGGWSMFAGIEAAFKAAGKDYDPAKAPKEPSKIEGPWLWMMVPTDGPGGAAATNQDSLALATAKEKVKWDEATVAKEGVEEGDAVGKLTWTAGKIAPVGGDNVNAVMNALKLGAGDINDHSSYAWINVVSPADGKRKLLAGSDDSVKIWINGEVAHVNAVNRGAGNFQDEKEVTLKKGDNSLLVKVSERGGGWSMFVGFDPDGDLKYNLDSKKFRAVEAAGKLPTFWGDLKHAQ